MDQPTLESIVSTELRVKQSKCTPEARFVEDLNADSLDVIELIMHFEDAYNVTLNDADAAKIHTIADAKEALTKLGAKL
jgi:acyl carrier protein